LVDGPVPSAAPAEESAGKQGKAKKKTPAKSDAADEAGRKPKRKRAAA
ncbi:MAG: hypothetical protein JSS24_15600, partial [Proteobacteria bacterium]|nr:hypothetical protein [Pseudomonadota bacterium]